MLARPRRRRDTVIPRVLVILATERLVDGYPVEPEEVISAGHIQGAKPHPIGHTGIWLFEIVSSGFGHRGFIRGLPA